MIEKKLEDLAEAVAENTATVKANTEALNELLSILRNGIGSANSEIFAQQATELVSAKAEQKAPSFDEATDVIDTKPVKEEQTEQAEQAEQAEQPVHFSIEDARALVLRLIRWHNANNIGKTNPVDTLLAEFKTPKVTMLNEEQCQAFCRNAIDFCKVNEVA